MMKFINLSLLLIFFLTSFHNLNSQTTTEQIEVDVQVTYANRIGTTPPIRHLIPVSETDPEKRKRAKANRKPPLNFLGRGKRPEHNPNAQPQGADPVRQTSNMRNTGVVIEPLVNIEGLSNNFGSPHDPTGDIGLDYYLQAINSTRLAVFDKEGNMIGDPFAANTIWSSLGFSSAGDPIILYDQEVNRWVLTEFPNGNQLLVAVSQTSDPLGSWDAYNFGTPNFPDYPKYGVWSNAYSVTTNEGGGLPSYFIDREALLNGDDMVTIQRIVLPDVANGPGFFVATPVDWSGLTPPPAEQGPIVLRLNDDAWGESAEDRIDVFSIDIDWDNPDNTIVSNSSVITAPYDTNPCSVDGFGFTCVPQLDGGGLDGLPETILNQAHYRNFNTYEALVFTFIVDATAGENLSGMRWMEFRRTPGNDWTVYQEGTYAPDDGLDRYAGSIAMDGKGNIALAYAASSEEEYVSTRFTGRRSSDPLGEMTVEEYVIASGTNSINSGARFGDYAHMSIDPTDDCTFWFTGEYAGGGGGLSSTRIVAFQLRKDTTDIGATSLIAPQPASDLTDMETIQVQVRNFGVDTQSVFKVGYLFEDQPAVIEDVTFVLAPDSTYIHTFTPTVDMSLVADYNFKVFTELEGDLNLINDTLRAVVSRLPRWDAGITGVAGLEDVNCADSLIADIELTNFGTLPLDSVTITIMLNGALYQTIEWVGELAPGSAETIPVVLTGLIDGENEFMATTSMPNGEVDEITSNDGFSRIFTAITNGVTVRLNLTTDFYPDETTWELEDEDGNILYSGGPYDSPITLFVEEWCLDPDACYTFNIFDSYGDGICCAFGQGNYSIVDADGITLLDGNGQFGTMESNDFCATFMCMLDADIEISPETTAGAADGAILIVAANGIGPYQYSIDGGASFQDNNMFSGLLAGDYNIVVQGEANCLFETTVSVTSCALDLLVTAMNESIPDAGDGNISITVSNGQPPFTYSNDGGDTFQSASLFVDLGMGVYNVLVRDALGCEATQEVIIDIETDADEQLLGQSIEVFPNPTKDVFRININGLNHNEPFLYLEIFNESGQRVQVGSLVVYDGQYTGLLTLEHSPAGVYYVRFLSEDVKRMVSVVKL